MMYTVMSIWLFLRDFLQNLVECWSLFSQQSKSLSIFHLQCFGTVGKKYIFSPNVLFIYLFVVCFLFLI